MSERPREGGRPIRVALSNDYEIALLGLAEMLAQHPADVQIVDLTTLTKMPHEPDVILYDSFGRLPDNDVKLRTIVEQNPAKVVMYSHDEYPEEAALRNGAAGYLHKSLTSEELVAAIVSIHDGTPRKEVEAAGEPIVTWPGQSLGLTQRESDMLTLITRGLSNDEIVRRSYLSINTVKSYIRSAYRKIGVKTRAQAVAWGYRHGFQTNDGVGV